MHTYIYSSLLPTHIMCQLCSKPYKEPRILPCLHSFCGQCLHKVIERSGAKHNLECPTCQRSITILEGEVNAMPQNVSLRFEVEAAEYMSKIGRHGEKSCDACIDGSSHPAVVFCCTCHELLCSYCHEYHKRSRKLSNHTILGLQNVSLKLLPSFAMKPIEHLCSQPHHEKEELNFYCETCQLLTCKECTLVLHKNHMVAEMWNIAKIRTDAMRKAISFGQEEFSKLTRAIDANEKMAEQVETSRENATQIINEVFKQLYQTVEERKMTLLAEMEAISLSKITALTLQKEQLMKIKDELVHYTEMTSHILQTRTDHEIITLGDLLLTELNAALKKVENVSLTPNQTSDIHVSLHTVDSLTKELSTFGLVIDSPPAQSTFSSESIHKVKEMYFDNEITMKSNEERYPHDGYGVDSPPSPSQSTWSSESVAKLMEMYRINVVTMTSKGEKYPCGGLQIKAELRPKSHNGAVVPGEVEDHGDGTYAITLIPQTAGPHQLHITMDDQHIQKSPCDLHVRKVHTYSTLCSPQQVIQCSGGPAGIAIHDSGDIYVVVKCWTDDSIHVFDQAGQQKRTIGSRGKEDGQFIWPFGLFIKGDMMYVADYGNNRIQKLTTEGEFLQKFGQDEPGHGDGQFKGPIAVIVDQMDRLIVAEYVDNKVVILDQAGTRLLTINGNGTGIQAFTNPYGLALDPKGNIHVTAYGPNAIKVFTPEGTCVRSYWDVKGPSGIVIDEEGYSFVNEETGNSLSIFDPQGNKIHTAGNLNKPRGIILDPVSGSLYVANYGANTVLKYSL